MGAFWSGTVPEFLDCDPDALLDRLAAEQMRRFPTSEATQLRAWEEEIALLRVALRPFADRAGWRVLLEYPLLRLGRRIDAVLATDRAILVLEFKVGAGTIGRDAREQAEDYALDLLDFHGASRRHPIVPIVVATEARLPPAPWPLLIPGVTAVQEASRATLPDLLRAILCAAPLPTVPLDPGSWENAPYRPVPTIVEAASMLYANHGVADIAAARAEIPNLTRTTQAILRTVAHAREARRHVTLFVTGIPGAGKTLCGLNATFGTGHAAGATFLTGNPTLVHVLREALARDAATRRRIALRVARQQVESAIQVLPRFRDHHVANAGEIPAEHVVVVDEAQRCWSRDHAVAKTQDRRVALRDSEPGHLLDIMRRHEDWAVMVCVVGGGQEIHTGEGGLAEWGAALRARAEWEVVAAPDALASADRRQVLPALPGLRVDPDLHLDVSVRGIGSPDGAAWVEAVLRGDRHAARAIADGGTLPFFLTRDLGALRPALRAACRGTRRAGLVASSGAARLRADGLGAELPHMDAGAVARWFLDRWPDVRASDALEVVSTEFSCQGLELDHAGLCWGGDLVRAPDGSGWVARTFHGTVWQTLRGEERVAKRLNTYRVLLTRARYGTIIWVPRGAPDDDTRPPAELDAVSDFLAACGARPLGLDPVEPVFEDRALLLV
jgi:Uncharacterized conserved protein (DUF2075)